MILVNKRKQEHISGEVLANKELMPQQIMIFGF